jgi:hypothetical protein
MKWARVYMEVLVEKVKSYRKRFVNRERLRERE